MVAGLDESFIKLPNQLEKVISSSWTTLNGHHNTKLALLQILEDRYAKC